MSTQIVRRTMVACLGVLTLTLAACSINTTGHHPAPAVPGRPLNASVPSWCGPNPISFALADGFGGNNWRKVALGEAKAEIAECPSVTSFSYTDGQSNTQKAVSDIQGLVAKGAQALVVFPDAGQAMLPALRSAYRAGVITVPYRVSPGGQAGTDYDAFVSTDFQQVGVLWAQWLVKALNGKGNVLNLGGPPANSQSLAEFQGMQSVLAKLPGHPLRGQHPVRGDELGRGTDPAGDHGGPGEVPGDRRDHHRLRLGTRQLVPGLRAGRPADPRDRHRGCQPAGL